MNFDTNMFIKSFKSSLNQTMSMKLSTQVDTQRIFMAADRGCQEQAEFFVGKSFFNGKHGNGEFLCDYTFRTSTFDVLLSLESEWGKQDSHSKTLNEVEKDFIKIINMASPVKIMVFAYVDSNNEDRIMTSLSNILSNRKLSMQETIIAISCPWFDVLSEESIKCSVWDNSENSFIFSNT
ncbi:MAG: hypothetical protein HRT95_09550 [Moritella sp.]|uniref:hypothetical protein n=1 Tax=Moritella sp. TaxID=78556 RepID=UPI001D410270|nr:hypothetical protein [Moritella sp.]NQZ50403.1 hypothetical protein [Moritella sp.]